jgi:putative ABC transport system ATP-binding protein
MPGTATSADGGIVIDTRNLWKSYFMGDQEIHAVAGIDVRIRRGEYVAIMGPSGSGESTLMNLIGCLDSPIRGEYYINSNELAQIRNREIGFVFQTFNLLPRAPALHNVELPLIYSGIPAAERKERARVALRKVDLGERMHHKPNEMSGGQRQRGEPTGNLDTATGNEITIVLVTHEFDIAAHARRVIHMRDGRVENDAQQGSREA